jgi:hypothetical protein
MVTGKPVENQTRVWQIKSLDLSLVRYQLKRFNPKEEEVKEEKNVRRRRRRKKRR